ncbi:hypothetical protein [Nodularia sp. NIES-3585]|uniref:hypothetical protein n=1 Tax=Nodularia sp. NIES-3585 TaxID=1973477 RepID=UPI000B5C5DEE|nr:hypothetical protein [Nodularia sp. NIES-3585]GAX37202.1 hypothetical protein NIES3585_32440 [Nodularia sp. NIES-3585]
MTVRVYIWRGAIPFASIYNGVIFKKDAGHASMEIIDNLNKKNYYISHQFDENKFKEDTEKMNEAEKVHQKIYGTFRRLDGVTFQCDWKEYGRSPDFHIDIPGLNEEKMIAAVHEYHQNKLVSKITIDNTEYTINRSEYQLSYNNCCCLVAYFIKLGMGCPKDSSCYFCYPNGNISPRRKAIEGTLNLGSLVVASLAVNPLGFLPGLGVFLGIRALKHGVSFVMDMEQYGMNVKTPRELFWSPITLEHFVKNVKNVDVTCKKV